MATVSGSVGGISVSIPFNTTANFDLAQQAFDSAATVVSVAYTPTSTVSGGTVPGGTQGVVVTVSGLSTYDQLPTSTTLLVASGDGNTVSAIGGNTPMTVESGANSTLVFVNNDTSSVPSAIFLGGGNNYVGEGSSLASAVINVDGSSVAATSSDNSGKGGAYIDGYQGFTTVNLYNNANVYLNTGSVAAGIGQDVVFAQSGTADVLGIGGSSTVPVTVTANAGTTLTIFDGATAYIAPGAGNIVLSGAATSVNGQATLFGGTGSDTLSGGGGASGLPQVSGYFQGGSAGNNQMFSSTVSGATTIIGAGNNNNLGAFGNNDSVLAGNGNDDTIFAGGGATGDTLIGGGGKDTIFGSSAGHTDIGFGSGTGVASGWVGSNTYFQAAAGGTDTINDFLPNSGDVFSLTLSSAYEGHTVTLTSINNAGTGSLVTLSDGSTINFVGVHVTSSNFT